MAFMAALATFLWSNENSDYFWHFKLSFEICKIAEVSRLIDIWMSDDFLCQPFCDMEGVFVFLFFGFFGYDTQSDFHCHHQYQNEMQQEIWGIQSNEDERDVVCGVALIGESLCTFF